MSTMRANMRQRMLTPALTVLLLGACSLVTPPVDTRSEAQTRASRLALGTVSLEGTARAVDSAAAAQLLPMWELLSELSSSPTAAPEEIAATVEAIEAAMTADQLSAIGNMSFSESEMDAANPAEAASSDAQAAAVAMDPAVTGEMGGDMAGGLSMDGGAPPYSGGNPTGASGRSLAGARLSSGGGSGVFRSVIALLESKTHQS